MARSVASGVVDLESSKNFGASWPPNAWSRCGRPRNDASALALTPDTACEASASAMPALRRLCSPGNRSVPGTGAHESPSTRESFSSWKR